MASEYDALFQEADKLQEGWRTAEDGTAEARLVRCIADLAAALRASEARAQAAEKRERAYREALLTWSGLRGVSFCIEVGCNNPATTTKLWNLSKVPVCPEHAPEVGGIAEQTDA
jgi:hypothetical protein